MNHPVTYDGLISLRNRNINALVSSAIHFFITPPPQQPQPKLRASIPVRKDPLQFQTSVTTMIPTTTIFSLFVIFLIANAAPSPSIKRNISAASHKALNCRGVILPSRSMARSICAQWGCGGYSTFSVYVPFKTKWYRCKEAPAPTPSSSPIPAPTITGCTYTMTNQLNFQCICALSDGTQDSSSSTASNHFSGTNRRSESCFETCLVIDISEILKQACEVDLSLDSFNSELNNAYSGCCSGCDAEYRNDVCTPFEP